MDRRFHTNPFVSDPDDPTTTTSTSTPESADSPISGDDTKMTTMPSPKKSRKSVQKKVVSVRIGDLDGSRSKGEGYPPSDSWAWRKYGQKPIKGSPYPRGYYRCSSSKGCPARKQVERSHVDPTLLIITYASDHNHAFPTTKHQPTTTTTTSPATATATVRPEIAVFENQPDFEPDDTNFPELAHDSLLTQDEFSWFSDVGPTSPTVFDSPVFAGSDSFDADLAVVLSIGEEDESLFADLGELPECSVVFRRGVDEHGPRCSVPAPCCGSTG
ncbi:hypothetical protein L1049_024283 [Liquidambar formosana]|uniref:WRKY domain-containing protein n=1 Tax=Liquidambar formosana TaxID=63359 RepID=A0AAP0X4G1_LIQFO